MLKALCLISSREREREREKTERERENIKALSIFLDPFITHQEACQTLLREPPIWGRLYCSCLTTNGTF
jgi:hypothetical protein